MPQLRISHSSIRFGDTRLPPRFWAKVRHCGQTGCWLWTGGTNGKGGYGRFRWSGKKVGAHRLAYETLIGQIPRPLVPDHLCKTPSCVNPLHMEPVTESANFRRGTGTERANATQRAKTHCPRGHEYSPDNTYVRSHNQSRVCRACARLLDKRRRDAAANLA